MRPRPLTRSPAADLDEHVGACPSCATRGGRSRLGARSFSIGAVAVSILVASRAGPLVAQESPPEFRSDTEVVVLDVVVRDDEGRTVRDLRPDEIQVFEDDVPQEIVSFHLRATGEERGARSGAVPGAPEAGGGAAEGEDARHVNLVTLVFDQLGPDGRRIARQAGLTLAGLVDRPDMLVSVFTVRESLQLVQQFTAERESIKTAVLEATGDVNTHYTDATGRLQEAVKRDAEARRKLEELVRQGGIGTEATAARVGQEVNLARLAVDALRMTQSLQHEQQGHATLYSLLALSRQQQRLAGRKTILFFSEGLRVPPSLEHLLRSTISEANRANVAIYTVDARGLSETRRFEATREALQQAALSSQRQLRNPGYVPITREEALAMETAETSLRMDTQGALADLSAGTGGALIADTNDVRPGIERAVGDLRGYYELAYTPTRREYDGTFRRIEVEVTRPKVKVQARSGYFALPPGEGTATFAYEVDLLKALRARPAPHAFTVRAVPFRFGPEGGFVRHTLVVEVPLAGIRFEPDERGETDRAHLSILAVLRAPTGEVVEKLSEDSPVFLPRQQRAALKRGNAVFLRTFTAPPGRYTLETAVVDRLAGHYSVRRRLLEVAGPAPGLAVSELALIRRTEAIPAGVLSSADPFRQGETRLVPWLSEPRLRKGDALSVFLVTYPPNARPADVLLEFLRDGQLVGQSFTELPPPEPTAGAPFVAAVPTEDLEPGEYEVRVLVKQGGLVAQRKARFLVEDVRVHAGNPPPGPSSRP